MKRSRDSEEDVSCPLPGKQEVSSEPVSKVVGLDVESSNDEAETTTALQCSMPGHPPGLTFATYREYETHYNSTHTNRCLECGRNFPSSHYLDLHIAECHDALVEVKKDRGEAVYACLVDTCAERFRSFKKRENHLIKSHMFPANYFFAVTTFGIDKRKSLLRNLTSKKHRNKSQSSETKSTENTGKSEGAKDVTSIKEASQDTEMFGFHDDVDSQTVAVDTDMNDLTQAMSSMKFVPRAVRFGPKQKLGFARR